MKILVDADDLRLLVERNSATESMMQRWKAVQAKARLAAALPTPDNSLVIQSTSDYPTIARTEHCRDCWSQEPPATSPGPGGTPRTTTSEGRTVTDDLTADDLLRGAGEARDSGHHDVADRLGRAADLMDQGWLLTPPQPSQPGTVTTAVQELRELTACRCNEAWTGRGLHDPSCASEYREDVETIVAALPQPGTVTLPASVVRALLPESHEAALVARRALAEVDRG